jgi:hypothetical protein
MVPSSTAHARRSSGLRSEQRNTFTGSNIHFAAAAVHLSSVSAARPSRLSVGGRAFYLVFFFSSTQLHMHGSNHHQIIYWRDLSRSSRASTAGTWPWSTAPRRPAVATVTPNLFHQLLHGRLSGEIDRSILVPEPFTGAAPCEPGKVKGEILVASSTTTECDFFGCNGTVQRGPLLSLPFPSLATSRASSAKAVRQMVNLLSTACCLIPGHGC